MFQLQTLNEPEGLMVSEVGQPDGPVLQCWTHRIYIGIPYAVVVNNIECQWDKTSSQQKEANSKHH